MIMILLRVLLLGSLIWLIWAVWRQISGKNQPKAPEKVENMVQCASCGQHVPESSATAIDGRHYCPQHRPGRDS